MADFNFSVFAGAAGTSSDDSQLVEVLDNVITTVGQEDRWQRASDHFWYCLNPIEGARRPQGWKLHLSATPKSAEIVLTRVLPILLGGNSAFKFASTIAQVASLNSRNTPRGHSGKFITVYPQNDQEAVRLAEVLHEATVGLAGPRILSDRPYAPGSLVHYRYGAFVEERRLGNDGLYSWVIFDPDGNPVEDKRVGSYLPPSWAPCPFPVLEPTGAAVAKSGDGGVLLGDRFNVREAIRHTNKGGVYRAVDTQGGGEQGGGEQGGGEQGGGEQGGGEQGGGEQGGGEQVSPDVVIKEARPHVEVDVRGKDVRDALRAEARALELIGPLGVGPRLLGLFEQSDHLFLAEELVPGVPLRQWVLDQIRASGWRRHIPDALETVDRLITLMEVAHRAGIVLRDFNPNNIMVRPDGDLWLIDLELAVVASEEEEGVTRSGTPGYVAPEQMEGVRAAFAADYYSLGATICFVVTGSTPSFLAEEPEAGEPEPRPMRERLDEWLTVREAGPDRPDLRALILGLMDDVPERRWTTTDARDAVAAARHPFSRRPATPVLEPDTGSDRLDDEQWSQAVEGIVGYLLASMDAGNDERLWSGSCAQGAPDPCTLQLGAAGVLGVLTRHLELTGDERLPEAIAAAGEWVVRRLGADSKRPPGLHFGEAGIAWSLYEAGRVLGDHRLADQGLALARTLPVSSPNPDITHGTAGIGLAFLHLWLRTGDEEFAMRASESADAVLASAAEEPGGLIWGTPAAFESRLAGGRYYGFAHGTAGPGYFLLASALATGRSDCLAMASRAGETLLDTAVVDDGAAQWGAGPGDPPTAPYWCHGSAGIGSFLARLHRATGDDRFGKVAHMAAQAVMENSWRGVLGQCHGLAGNGEFLLDLAEAGDGEQYKAQGHQLARIIYASRARHGSGAVFPDEQGTLSPSWADGVSGILAFLLRLRFSSPRLWMVDSLLERGHQP